MGTPNNEPPSTQPLSSDLVRAEVSPSDLRADEGSKAEGWWLWKYLPGKPSREGVELTSLIIDTVLRVGMSVAFLWMAWWWLGAVDKLIEKQCEADSTKHLSDAVLIALLTTTTINVLGLLYFVANYLFPKQVPMKNGDPTPSPPTPPSLTDPPR